MKNLTLAELGIAGEGKVYRNLAVSELVKKGKTITEAATEAGFNNYSTFYRAYKNLYKSSPNKKKFENFQ